MILYVNGDSNSAGSEISDQSQSWPNLLASKLNCILINQAVRGGSNPGILRTTYEFINSCSNIKDHFLVIGWTSWEREEWNYNNNYHNVNAGGHTTLPAEFHAQYKNWVIEQTEETRILKSSILHNEICKLHEILKQQDVKHLFFNALMPYLHIEHKQIMWANYLGPYDNNLSYYWYLKNCGYVPTVGNHHLEDAARAWTDVLYNYIQENKLV
jgi:hypothetical protein